MSNSFRQGGAFNELEHQGLGLACVFNPVNLPDVGMIQGGQHLRFSLESTHSLGIRGKLLGQYLQRHVPIQLGIGGTVDLSHTPLAYFLSDFVVADGRSDHTIPPHCAVQLGSMVRREAAKDNGKTDSRLQLAKACSMLDIDLQCVLLAKLPVLLL